MIPRGLPRGVFTMSEYSHTNAMRRGISRFDGGHFADFPLAQIIAKRFKSQTDSPTTMSSSGWKFDKKRNMFYRGKSLDEIAKTQPAQVLIIDKDKDMVTLSPIDNSIHEKSCKKN